LVAVGDGDTPRTEIASESIAFSANLGPVCPDELLGIDSNTRFEILGHPVWARQDRLSPRSR
jgi:hypothetical protein